VRYSKNKDFSWLQLVRVLGPMDPVLLRVKGCGVKCCGANCRFVRCSKNKDFWLQLMNVFGLTVPVLLLGVKSSRGAGQCCGSGMFIPDPDFYPSRIPDPKTATKERDEKKLVVIPFYVATNLTKL
jgi:hypothetical protein